MHLVIPGLPEVELSGTEQRGLVCQSWGCFHVGRYWGLAGHTGKVVEVTLK